MRTNCAPTSEVSRFAAVVAAAAPSEHASALAMSIVASARWLELAERSGMARVRVRAQAGGPRATRGVLTPKLSFGRHTDGEDAADPRCDPERRLSLLPHIVARQLQRHVRWPASRTLFRGTRAGATPNRDQPR